jgi:hypothetical protein
MSTIKSVLENWALAQIRGRSQNAPGAIGRGILFGSGGQTTAIASVDATRNIVTTVTGSVYKLGTPNLGFAITHQDVMRELGF